MYTAFHFRPLELWSVQIEGGLAVIIAVIPCSSAMTKLENRLVDCGQTSAEKLLIFC